MSASDVELNTEPDKEESTEVAVPAPTATVPPRAIARIPRVHIEEDEPLLVSSIRKRWWVLLICALASAFAAAGVARQYAQSSAELGGSLLYTGLPLPPGPKVYTPLSMEAYAELLANPTVLNAVIEKRGLPMTAAALEQAITVQTVGRAGIVNVIFQWEDAAEGEQILNDLMEVFNDQVVERRRTTITEHIRHVERTVLANKARVEDASERLRDFHRQHGYDEQDLQQLPNTVTALQSALESAEVAKASLEIQLTKLAEIHETIASEFKNTLIAEKQNKFRQAASVFSPRHKDWKRLEQIGKKLETMAAAAPEDKTPPDVWKLQLDDLGGGLLPELDQYPFDAMQPLEVQLAQAETRRSEVELSVYTKTAEVAYLRQRLADKQREFEQRKQESQPQIDHMQELSDDLNEADVARQRVQNQLASLRQLEQCRVREFAVVTPATLTTVGITSNAKKLFVATFCLAVVLLSGPVFACEYFSRRENSWEATARRLGLPVLSRGSIDRRLARNAPATATAGDNESLRLLALRIQQSLHRSGSIIVFSGLEHEESPLSLMTQLAECFAEREENVLVIDANKSSTVNSPTLHNLVGDAPHLAYLEFETHDTGSEAWAGALTGTVPGKLGISDYLSHEELNLADLVLETRIPRVDCVHAGSRPFPREGLATRRMTELLEKCRKHYSLILIAGPSTRHRPDVEMLAARADGMLFTAPRSGPALKNGQDVLKDLIDLEAPVLGVIG